MNTSTKIEFIIRRFTKFIKQFVKIELLKLKSRLRGNFLSYPLLYDVRGKGNGKNALLVYLVPPFIKGSSYRHHNEIRNIIMADTLASLGFCVDVIDVRSKVKQIEKKYDIITSVSVDFPCQMNDGKANSKKVFFATGAYPLDRIRKTKKRYNLLFERRGIKLRPKYPDIKNLCFVHEADFIIGIGNEHTIGTYKKIKKYAGIIWMNNHFYNGTEYIKRNFSKSKKNFLFMASFEPVRTGLDLLLELFSKRKDINIYIVGYFFEDLSFCIAYRKELFCSTNIYSIGFTDVRSNEFKNIAEMSSFVILPTCSEGQSSSLVQAMATGLIPIATKESGVDIDKYKIGFTIKSGEEAEVKLQDIEDAIDKALNMSIKELEELSYHVRKTAENYFSEEAFKANFREAMLKCVA